MPICKAYDRDFFKTWTGDMAYVLGFLYADGNIIRSKRGNHYVAFYSADFELLEMIRSVVRSDHKISMCGLHPGACRKLQIGSKEWFGDLGRLGLIPGKTKRMRLPEVPDRFLRDFIRGYFDGDGNVWAGQINKNRMNPTMSLMARFTSCSYEFLIDVLCALRGIGIKKGVVHTAKRGVYSILTLSTLDSLKLYEIMYNSPCGMFLDRKRLIFEKFKQMRV